jgi:hypothetical protein
MWLSTEIFQKRQDFVMLNFKPLTLDDIPTIRPFLKYQQSRICDYSIGGIFMWREFFKTRYTIYHGVLIFQVTYLSGVTAFTVPLAPNPEGITIALAAIEQHCRETNLPLVFCTVPANVLPRFRERYPSAFIQPSRDWFDYLYLTEDLISFRGKKYDGQRNHINKFRKMVPDYSFEEITEENLPQVCEFYDNFAELYEKPSELAREESSKVKELLRNYDKYGLFGGVIKGDGQIISMSIGERVNDTLFVHVEKADIRYPGAYQVIVQEFLKHFAQEGDTYVNREEDVGDPGLRKSKLSYHPTTLLEKSVVLVGNL